MTTFDSHGMTAPYKLNRELNEHELEHLLKIKKKQSDHPHYELSLIRFNSCFAESVGLMRHNVRVQGPAANLQA